MDGVAIATTELLPGARVCAAVWVILASLRANVAQRRLGFVRRMEIR